MSNHKAIEALDAAIATLASTRDEIQKRHDETTAALATAEAVATHKPARMLLLQAKGFPLLGKR